MSKRFSLLIDDTFRLRGRGIVVIGHVRGTVTRGDAAYVVSSNGSVRQVTVHAVEIALREQTEQANDLTVALELYGIECKEQAAQLSVISSVRPSLVNGCDRPAFENPYLGAMIAELGDPRLKVSGEPFLPEALRAIREGRYLACVEGIESPLRFSTAAEAMAAGATGFSTMGALEEGRPSVMLFTSEDDAMRQGRCATAGITFKELATIYGEGFHAVFDPFGPHPVRF